MVGVIGTVGQRVVQRVKPGDALILVAEYLDDFLALHHLLDIAVDRAQIALLRYEICAGPARELFGDEQHKAHHHQRQPCQRQAEGKHGAEYADDRYRRRDELGHALADHLAQRVDVVGVNAHDIAVGMGVEITDGQALHMPE